MSIFFLISLFLILLGLGYLYAPSKVIKFNSWVRENLFSDRFLLLYRKKTGVFLVLLGAVILYLLIKR